MLVLRLLCVQTTDDGDEERAARDPHAQAAQAADGNPSCHPLLAGTGDDH